MRVAVYNVRGFRSGVDAVANALERYRPDVILLQESGSRRALRGFARAMRMELAADPRAVLARRVKDAVLVREPWRILEHRQHRFRTVDKLFPRGALVAELLGNGGRCAAVSIHLGLRPAERVRHARELRGILGHLDAPVLVGGDLNERPDGEAVRALANVLRDAWLLGGDGTGETFPAEDPTARIDYLFVSQGLRVERAIVPSGPSIETASDHRPLIAEVAFPS